MDLVFIGGQVAAIAGITHQKKILPAEWGGTEEVGHENEHASQKTAGSAFLHVRE
jgi:hypothetical protein